MNTVLFILFYFLSGQIFVGTKRAASRLWDCFRNIFDTNNFKSMNSIKKELTQEQREELLVALKARFEKNMKRHKGLDWTKLKTKLEHKSAGEKLWSLNEMERTGGEPDVVGFDIKTGEYIFYDCSAESPKGRRSVCYDREGLESRKDFKPENSAVDMACCHGH